ncbi:MAG: D-hexose-6-phosphate mutarotase [Thalassolituus sp.]
MSAHDYTFDPQNCLDQSRFCTMTTRGDLSGISVNHPDFSSFILFQGAQLLEFKSGSSDWIWLSEEAEYETGTSVRGGIPVCWPWFGNADKNPESVQKHILSAQPPAHGFARTQNWQLSVLNETDNQIVITLQLATPENDHWNSPAEATLTFTLSKQALTLELTTTATERSFTFSQALHTYFPTTDIHQTRISGINGYSYIDAMDNWQTKQQSGDIVFTEETDRIYQVPSSADLITPTHRFTLTSNSQSAVVWNPWVDKAERLSQFANDAWQRMFCVETANVMEDVVSLEAGQTHTLKLTLTRS